MENKEQNPTDNYGVMAITEQERCLERELDCRSPLWKKITCSVLSPIGYVIGPPIVLATIGAIATYNGIRNKNQERLIEDVC